MFGDKPQVVIYDEGFALITFKDFFAAYVAQYNYNNMHLAKNNIKLIVKWVPKDITQND